MELAAEEFGERGRERKRARVAADGANSSKNEDYGVNRKTTADYRLTQKRDLKKKWPADEEIEGSEAGAI